MERVKCQETLKGRWVRMTNDTTITKASVSILSCSPGNKMLPQNMTAYRKLGANYDEDPTVQRPGVATWAVLCCLLLDPTFTISK